MWCPKCGKQIPDNSKFCPKCGYNLQESDEDQDDGGKPEKKKHTLVYALLSVLVLALAAGGGFTFYRFVLDDGGIFSSHKESPLTKDRDADEKEADGKDADKKEADGKDADGKEPDGKALDKDEPDEARDESDASPDEGDADAAIREGMSGKENGLGIEGTKEASVPAQPAAAGAVAAGTAAAGAVPASAAASAEHTYQLIVKDCTWTEAYQEAKAMGGYLVNISTSEEYEKIKSQIISSGFENVKFWVGGMRDPGSYEYHWVDANGVPGTDVLNSEDYSYQWMVNEPSFQDGTMVETYMNIFYYKNESRWVWNDVPDDIIAVVPSYSGSVGYICEFDY